MIKYFTRQKLNTVFTVLKTATGKLVLQNKGD